MSKGLIRVHFCVRDFFGCRHSRQIGFMSRNEIDKFKIVDAEPRLLNDDEILATIGHPSDILHVL